MDDLNAGGRNSVNNNMRQSVFSTLQKQKRNSKNYSPQKGFNELRSVLSSQFNSSHNKLRSRQNSEFVVSQGSFLQLRESPLKVEDAGKAVNKTIVNKLNLGSKLYSNKKQKKVVDKTN